MTPSVLRLEMEAVLRIRLRSQAKISKLPHAPRAALSTQRHSIQGTPTARVLDHAHIQEASHHQRHTNPITEKERVPASN